MNYAVTMTFTCLYNFPDYTAVNVVFILNNKSQFLPGGQETKLRQELHFFQRKIQNQLCILTNV